MIILEYSIGVYWSIVDLQCCVRKLSISKFLITAAAGSFTSNLSREESLSSCLILQELVSLWAVLFGPLSFQSTFQQQIFIDPQSGIISSMDMSVSKPQKIVRDREGH